MKKVVLILVVLFIGFWILTDPRGLATLVSGAGGTGWDALLDFFAALIRFIGNIDLDL